MRLLYHLAIMVLAAGLAACSGELSTTTVGGCMAGERQLHSSGQLATSQGMITVSAPAGTNFTLCAW